MKNRVFATGALDQDDTRTGYVIGMVGSEFALVQFEHPKPSQRLIAIRDMLAWTFYADNAAAEAALAALGASL